MNEMGYGISKGAPLGQIIVSLPLFLVVTFIIIIATY